MESKAESIQLFGKVSAEIQTKYRRTSGSKSPQRQCAQKYISSIERLRACNISIWPKSPINSSSYLATERSCSGQQDIVSNPAVERRPHHKKSISEIHQMRKCHLMTPLVSKSPARTSQLESKSSRKSPLERRRLISTGNAPKKPLKYQAQEDFLQAVSLLSFKQIYNLKKNLNYSLRGLDTMLAFLSILADCGIDLLEHPKKITMKTIDDFKMFLSNPGKLVKILRNIPDFIRSGNIQHKTIAKARDLVTKRTNNLMKEMKIVVQETIKLFAILRPPYENDLKAKINTKKRCEKGEISPINNRPNSRNENQIPNCFNGNTNKARILNRYLNKESPRKEEKVINLLGFIQTLAENTVFKDLVNDIRDKEDTDQILRELLSKYND